MLILSFTGFHFAVEGRRLTALVYETFSNTRASIQHAQNIAARQSDAASNKAIRVLRNAASAQSPTEAPTASGADEATTLTALLLAPETADPLLLELEKSDLDYLL